MDTKPNIFTLILAAGNASRLGRPKQLLMAQDDTLIEKCILTSLASNSSATFVVLGANADLISVPLAKYKIKIILNSEWQEGIASSIRAGIQSIQREEKKADGVLILLVDQVLVTTTVINEIIEKYLKNKHKIVASKYATTIGPPALFDKEIFDDLLNLEGNAGAKKIMDKHKLDLYLIDFPDGQIDIDTMEDYLAYQQSLIQKRPIEGKDDVIVS